MEMIELDLTDGQHIRPEGNSRFIARSYVYLPSELKSEIEKVGNFEYTKQEHSI